MVSRMSCLLTSIVVFDSVLHFAAASRYGRRELQQTISEASHSTSVSFRLKSNTSQVLIRGKSSEPMTILVVVGVGKLCLSAWKGGALIHGLTHAAAAHGATAKGSTILAKWVSSHGVHGALHMGCMAARGGGLALDLYINFWSRIVSLVKEFKSMKAQRQNCMACIEACPASMPFTKKEIERCFHWQSAALPCNVHTCQAELSQYATKYAYVNPGVSSFDRQDAKALGKIGLKIAATIEGAPFSTELGMLIDGNWKAAAKLMSQEVAMKGVLWFCQNAGV